MSAALLCQVTIAPRTQRDSDAYWKSSGLAPDHLSGAGPLIHARNSSEIPGFLIILITLRNRGATYWCLCVTVPLPAVHAGVQPVTSAVCPGGDRFSRLI
jgi:hypothetical protein